MFQDGRPVFISFIDTKLLKNVSVPYADDSMRNVDRPGAGKEELPAHLQHHKGLTLTDQNAKSLKFVHICCYTRNWMKNRLITDSCWHMMHFV